MQHTDAVVIVGAGHSGARAAHALRNLGFAGSIKVLGQESHLPYDRPPLSKGVLLGSQELDACQLYDADFYVRNRIDLQLNRRVDAIDREAQEVIDATGQRTPYSHLVLATGAEPRRLFVAGFDLPGVMSLRSADDAQRLRDAVCGSAKKHVVVVGAGFIGLEVAASAVLLGCRVTVVEMAQRALQRAVPPEITASIVLEHTRRGVQFRFGRGVQEIHGRDAVEEVLLTDGTRLACDVVVVGIGVVPAVHLARSAGLEIEDGICTNSQLQTSDPHIYAIGDNCAFPSELAGDLVRLESWKNAEDHAARVAAAIMGVEAPAESLPWFWSDQYDLTLQVVGLPLLGEKVVRRNLGDGALLFLALDGNDVAVGASALGTVKQIAREMRAAQGLISGRRKIAGAHDESRSLRELLAA